MCDIVLPKMVASVTRDVALRRRTAELELCAASMFVCHVLARLFRVTCFWPHQELQATSLKVAPRALCAAIVVYTHLCFTYHFHVGCVVSEFVLGAHSWLFGERRLLQLLALGHLFLEVMETEMGGADGSSDAQRRRSRSPSAQRLFLSAIEYTPQKAGDDDPRHHSTDGGGETEVLPGRKGHGQHRRADDTETSPSIVQSSVRLDDGHRPPSTPSSAPAFE